MCHGERGRGAGDRERTMDNVWTFNIGPEKSSLLSWPGKINIYILQEYAGEWTTWISLWIVLASLFPTARPTPDVAIA